jgi:hypothetical protein
MEDLKKQYDEKSAQKEELRKKAEMLEIKLDRAGKLVSGLAGERDRWEASVSVSISRITPIKTRVLGLICRQIYRLRHDGVCACLHLQSRRCHQPSITYFYVP